MLLAGGVPSIVVTHDRMEAVALGDWMAVMVDGRIRQTGPVQEVFRRPADAQVAESVGVENVLPARHRGPRGRPAHAARPARRACNAVDSGEAGPVWSPASAPRTWPSRASCHSLRARATACRAACARSSLEGPLARVELDCGFPLVAVITAQSAAELGLQPEQPVCAIVKTTAVHLAAWAHPAEGSHE